MTLPASDLSAALDLAQALIRELGGPVTFWSAGSERLYGWPAAEMVGRKAHETLETVFPQPIETIEAILRRDGRWDGELRQTRRDGPAVAVASHWVLLPAEEGGRDRVLEINTDVTDATRARRQLEEREAHLQSILDTVPDAMVVIDDRGLIQSFSRAAERMFGLRAEEAMGRNVSLLMPSPHRERHDGYIDRYLHTGERRIVGVGRVVTGLRSDGTTFPIELAVGEINLPGRRLFTGFMRDLTQRQRTEKRLQELQDELAHVARVSELGQMSAALTHELKQPLTAITNYIEACRTYIEAAAAPPPQLPGLLEKARAQTDRAGGIIQRLRELFKKGETEYRAENINKVVEEASALGLVGAQEARVQVRLELDPEMPAVFIDKIQVQQVVLNLVRNAVEAMAEVEERMLTIRTMRTEAAAVVTVRDTGPGLAEAVRKKLFMPFVTTKEKGMGIGLSVCRAIIEAHGGTISAVANADGGTMFSFSVPFVGEEDELD
jgi:two-component system, LuxR family, sensor kinase FixL